MYATGVHIYSLISFRTRLFIQSWPLLLLLGNCFINFSTSCGVVGCRNSVFLLLLIVRRYSMIFLLGLAIFSANLLPTVEKYSPNLFVMSSGLCKCRPFELRCSITLVLSMMFPDALLIKCHNSLVFFLFSAHLVS